MDKDAMKREDENGAETTKLNSQSNEYSTC